MVNAEGGINGRKIKYFRVPKDVQFLDALPREASGKIFKGKLRDLHAEGDLRAAT